ncbi:MAG: DNA mismatch repair endonuclease MutL [Bdellovibrionaceae bacterium]|nr:DNA mismatch repair endonuclease MutL [Pseudobdellovibrionaceae bacterium]
MSIQVLPKNVIDQIAAGEVVERPSHLVKELVENAIDAKSTLIEVHFEEGGRNILVNDNGVGINKEELSLAIERHATSKIVDYDDIWHLHSYGFRGEALASIAAVSDFEIISRTQEQEKAYKLVAKYGQQEEIIETSRAVGTQIRVQNLFENVPVRLKFLKTPAYEQGLIRQVLKALALSKPEIEFKIFENKKLLYYFPKSTDLYERSLMVLGATGKQEKSHFSFHEKTQDFQLDVVFSSPYLVEKNAKNLWLFVQERWIQDKVLVSSIMESYQNLLMHGEYPQVVLKLTLPSEEVDVNIHPTKSQVKFLSSQNVYRLIYKTLRREIEKTPWKILETNSQNTFSSSSQSHTVVDTEQHHLPAFDLQKRQYQQKDFHFREQSQVRGYSMETLPWALARRETTNQASFVEENSNQLNVFQWASLHVIGQLNLTYIVCQNHEKMILVDQHAAHERVLFEKIKDRFLKQEILHQNLLIPLSVDFEPDAFELLLENEENLRKLGIGIEQLGPFTIGITYIPAYSKEGAIVILLKKFIEELKEQGGSFVFEKKLNDMIATMACHSAVRAGQAMSIEEMQNLLLEMDEFPLSSFCPHGRPVNVEMSFYQIEKDFGRIV